MTASEISPEASTEESMVSLDGCDIHLYQDGPRDAPPLLLIHGTGASGRSWEPILPLLTGCHRVTRIDLPGCGGSSPPRAGGYAATNLGRLTGAALDRLGVERTVVVGHSSGGIVATALSEERPELVAGLVFLDTGPDMAAYIARDVPLRASSWTELSDDQLREAIRDGFHPGYAIPKAYLDQFRQIDFHTFAAMSRAIPPYLDERSLPDRLAPLGKPLLVLFGDQDSRWDPASTGDYLAVPGATVELLPGIGHSPNLEDPQLTAARLLSFAADLA